MEHMFQDQFFNQVQKSENNTAYNSGMDLARFRMLINELLNNNLDIVQEEYPMIVLDGDYDICMSNIGKYTRHTRHIER